MSMIDEVMARVRRRVKGQHLTIRELVPLCDREIRKILWRRKLMYSLTKPIKIMKKLLLLLPVIAIVLSFTSPGLPSPSSKLFSSSQAADMKEFVTKEGARLREAGWKYTDVKLLFQGENTYVTVVGTKVLSGGWSGCSDVAWGQPYASCPSSMNAGIQSLMLNYSNQGYNCVCRAGRNLTFVSYDGWTGYQWCETVTAKVSALCDCIPN